METELISKKDLLLQTKISYGQLYRWKRKNLIPEDWFIRKSTYTGQETFFPRERMLERVAKILSMKNEDLSLDDIASAVAPSLDDASLSLALIRERNIVSEATADLMSENRDSSLPLALGELVSLWALDTLLASGEISLEEGRVVLETLAAAYPGFEGREADLVVIRKLGVTVPLLVGSAAEVKIDPKARLVARLSLSQSFEALGAWIRS